MLSTNVSYYRSLVRPPTASDFCFLADCTSFIQLQFSLATLFAITLKFCIFFPVSLSEKPASWQSFSKQVENLMRKMVLIIALPSNGKFFSYCYYYFYNFGVCIDLSPFDLPFSLSCWINYLPSNQHLKSNLNLTNKNTKLQI